MLKRAGALVVLALALLVVAGPVLPVRPSYATSGSMAPAIDEGDAYFVVDADAIERGDIITFYSVQRNGYVTHRVVDRTAEGYVTKGDNNPSTDQAAGHPPVDPSAVLGKVVVANGRPLTVPGAGHLLAALQAHRLLLALAAALLVAPELKGAVASGGPRRREVVRVGDVVRPLLLGGFVVCFVLTLWGGSTHVLTYVATTEETGAAHTVPVGEPAVRTLTVETRKSPFTTVLLEADGMEIVDRTTTGSTTELTVRLPAVERTGVHRARLHVYAYPAMLPRGLLARLHEVHWLAGALGSLTPLFLPAVAAYLLLFDGSAPLHRPRGRWYDRIGGG